MLCLSKARSNRQTGQSAYGRQSSAKNVRSLQNAGMTGLERHCHFAAPQRTIGAGWLIWSGSAAGKGVSAVVASLGWMP
jgi:hypothetical protein